MEAGEQVEQLRLQLGHALVLEALNEESASVDGLVRCGLPDRFVSHGTREELLEEVKLTPRALCATVIEALAKNG